MVTTQLRYSPSTPPPLLCQVYLSNRRPTEEIPGHRFCNGLGTEDECCACVVNATRALASPSSPLIRNSVSDLNTTSSTGSRSKNHLPVLPAGRTFTEFYQSNAVYSDLSSVSPLYALSLQSSRNDTAPQR